MSDTIDDWVHKTFGVDPKSCSKAPADPAAALKLPAPMQADCKPVHGKVKGPENHLLCSTHGHVLDIKSKTIINHSLAEYDKMQAVAHQAIAGMAKVSANVKAATDKAAHQKAADDHTRAEFHKHLGLRPTDVILTVETVDGPAPELNIRMEATNTCAGPNMGVNGYATFKWTGSMFIAKQQDLPPEGIATFTVFTTTQHPIELTFTQVNYNITKGGPLKLSAVERAMRGSQTDSSNDDTTHTDSSGRRLTIKSELGGEVDLEVIKVGGKVGVEGTRENSQSDGTSHGTGQSDTMDKVVHSAIYDVHVIK